MKREFDICEFDMMEETHKLKLGQPDIRSETKEMKRYPENISRTSKYNLLTFLPAALFFQFRKWTNIYFALLLIPASFTIVAAYGLRSELPPFIFIMVVALLRELIEDIRRHRSDSQFNSSSCYIIRHNKLFKVQWRNIIVGDLVLLQAEDRIPADLIVIGTSSADGRCYMETSTLDGEKNLKPRDRIKHSANTSIDLTFDDNKNLEVAVVNFHARITVESPSYILYDFKDGYAEYFDEHNRFLGFKTPLESKNLLLKGAKLKNTSWVLAFVVYTGKDTQIQLNASVAKSKISSMEKRLYKVVISIFFGQIFIAIFAAFGKRLLLLIAQFDFNLVRFLVFVGSTFKNAEDNDTIASNLLDGFRYFLLLTTLIPISLIVNLEIVRFFQAVFMTGSYDLFSPERDIHCRVNTSSVNEELGEIEYLLTDKTGTLTQNKMVLEGLYIGETLFGGNFSLDSNNEIQGYESNLEKNKRLRLTLEEKFDTNLQNVLKNPSSIPLRKVLPLSSKKTLLTEFEALKGMTSTFGFGLQSINEGPNHPGSPMSGVTAGDIRMRRNESIISARDGIFDGSITPAYSRNFEGSVEDLNNIGPLQTLQDQLDNSSHLPSVDHLGASGEDAPSPTKGFNFEKGAKFFQVDVPNEMGQRMGIEEIMDTPYELQNQEEQDSTPKQLPSRGTGSQSLTRFAPFHLKQNYIEAKPKMSLVAQTDPISISPNKPITPKDPGYLFKKSSRMEGTGQDGMGDRKRSHRLSKADSHSPSYNYPHMFTSYQELITEFMVCATLCHECVVEMNAEHHYTYQGPSPDEIAICKGARDIGFVFRGRNSEGKAEVDMQGVTRTFEVKMVSLG